MVLKADAFGTILSLKNCWENGKGDVGLTELPTKVLFCARANPILYWWYFSESLSHWNGEIEDLDTEQLANALCAPVDDIKEENVETGGCRWYKFKNRFSKL